MRPTFVPCALLVAALASVVVLPGGSAAVAAAPDRPSCQGRVATVVGTPGGSATGTPGADVIVSNAARRVRGLGGDDLICVDRQHRSGQVVVDAGRGDDVTVVGDRHSFVRYDSGLGSDTYRSAGSTDLVTLRDDGHDVVSTGRRVDVVVVRHGVRAGRPQVSLGGSNDTLELVVGRSGGRFDGGGGDDRLSVRHRSQQVWTFDNRLERAVAGGEVRARWSGFSRFGLVHLVVPEVRFRGSAADETLEGGLHAVLRLAMGAGDDTAYAGRADDTVDGGPGTDWVDGSAGTDTCRSVETAYDCELTG